MVKMILAAATLAAIVSGAAITSSNRLVARTLDADNPPCSPNTFTPFTYFGCYNDSSERALPYVPEGLDNSKMTAAYCQAACKGKSVFKHWPRKLLMAISANNFKYSNEFILSG